MSKDAHATLNIVYEQNRFAQGAVQGLGFFSMRYFPKFAPGAISWVLCAKEKIPPLPPRKRGGARLGSHRPGDVTGLQPLGFGCAPFSWGFTPGCNISRRWR